MRTRRLIMMLWALAVFVAACSSADGSAGDPSTAAGGSPQPSDTGSAEPSESGPASPSGSADGAAATLIDTDLPDVDVVDVVSGEVLNLRSLVPSDRPTLLWFWAPH